jgi:hypothetical protein
MPLAWTDAAPIDPFVRQAAGRAVFRLVDLLAVVQLLHELSQEEV